MPSYSETLSNEVADNYAKFAAAFSIVNEFTAEKGYIIKLLHTVNTTTAP